MPHARAGAHTLDVARMNGRAVAHAVLVRQSAFEHITDDFHVAMAVCPKTLATRDAILVDHPQRAEMHVLRVVIAGERKAVIRIEPAVVSVAPFIGASNFEHVELPVMLRWRECKGAHPARQPPARAPHRPETAGNRDDAWYCRGISANRKPGSTPSRGSGRSLRLRVEYQPFQG